MEFLIPTKIEFSRRGLRGKINFATVNKIILQKYQLPPIMVNHYAADEALQQKIVALATRNHTQARDVFDLYILLTSYVKTIFFNPKTKSILDKAKENLLTITFQDYKSQVVAFLPIEYQNQYDSITLWDDIALTVLNALEFKKQ
jgi:predicted nucleotidyltransferase component of viral defense system